MRTRLVVTIICLLAFISYFIYWNMHRSHHRQDGAIAAIENVNNDVQSRAAQTLVWDSAKEGDELVYYDSLMTMSNSNSKVAFKDGTSIEMGPDSLIVLEPPAEAKLGLRLNLKQGTATLHLKKGQSIQAKNKVIFAKADAEIKIVSDFKNVEDTVSVKLDSQALTSPTEKTLASPVVISTVVEKDDVKKENLRLPSNVIPKQLPAPQIKFRHQIFNIEKSDQSHLSHGMLEYVSLLLLSRAVAGEVIPHVEWLTLDGALSYELEVSVDSAFKNVVMTKTTQANDTFLDLKKPGTYYWHVRGLDKDGSGGNFSETASFEIHVIEEKRIPAQVEPVASPTASPAPSPLPVEEDLPEAPVATPTPTLTPTPTPVATPTASPIIAAEESAPEPETMNPNLFALEGRALGSWGSMSDSAGLFPSRPMLTGTAEVAAGLRTGHFTTSLLGEYYYSSQAVQASTVQNQNSTGTGLLLGAELKYKRRKFSIAASYIFLGQFQLSQSTTISQTSIYDKPQGYGLTLGWVLNPRWSFLVNGQSLSFTDWNLAGNINSNQVKQFTYGIGLSYEFY